MKIFGIARIEFYRAFDRIELALPIAHYPFYATDCRHNPSIVGRAGEKRLDLGQRTV